MTDNLEELQKEVAGGGGLSPCEFAQSIGVEPRTVYRWIKLKIIVAFKRNSRWLIPGSQVKETLSPNSDHNGS